LPKTNDVLGAATVERFPKEPQENILYFIEKNAPNLEQWKREIIRIVRKLAQYFHPQMQTKLMNEGFATFTHYHIIQEMYARGLVTDGFMIEFMISHSGVTMQMGFDSKYFNGINPYALGFAMFQDIKRVCEEPNDEDRKWFPEIAGNGTPWETIKWIVENFKDESFVLQFLSPKVMRDFHMFAITDDEQDPMFEVDAIHNDSGYKTVREAVALQYNIGYKIPDIQVYNVDRWGDRSMVLRNYLYHNRPLEQKSAVETLKHVKALWGYNVKLEAVDQQTSEVKMRYDLSNKTLLDIFVTK
jgi:spore cortex formation protein SpoVR/YcgB (stage V sporulation)